MIENKKARGEMMGGIGRLILALISFAIVATILSNIFGPAIGLADSGRSLESFEEFVDELNSMNVGQKDVYLELNKKSAVIGFNQPGDAFECYSCPPNGNSKRITQRTYKPDNSPCNGKACICLCNGGFEVRFEGGTESMEGVWTGRCKNGMICRELTGGLKIVDETRIGKVTEVLNSYYQHWNNGFMFTREVSNADGFSAINHKGLIKLVIEKTTNSENLIGVCNEEILDFNQNELGINSCINKEQIS